MQHHTPAGHNSSHVVLSTGLASGGDHRPASSAEEAVAATANNEGHAPVLSSSQRPELVSSMLHRLQELPWRRIDVSFKGASFGFAHNNIQVCVVCGVICKGLSSSIIGCQVTIWTPGSCVATRMAVICRSYEHRNTQCEPCHVKEAAEDQVEHAVVVLTLCWCLPQMAFLLYLSVLA